MPSEVSTGAGFKTVAIVGVGLIGGSFALAIRKAGFTGRVIGVSSPATVRKALERGVIDQALPLADAASQADLIYLAQPIQQIIATLGEVDAHVRPGTLITDAGSTKVAISKTASGIQRGRFVGGHPMAGKESRGVEGADADLFRGRPYVLTSREPLLETMIERIGAQLVVLSAEEHDRWIALASHLPQMLSTALGSVLSDHPEAIQVAGPGAIDMTRLALSSYDIWRDILSTNRESVGEALDACIARLQQMRTELTDPSMEQTFARGAEAARALRKG